MCCANTKKKTVSQVFISRTVGVERIKNKAVSDRENADLILGYRPGRFPAACLV